MTHLGSDDNSSGDEEPRAIVKESSKIFRRNRALGYVSNQVPAVTRYVQRRRDTLLITCIGRSFQVYTASHMRLLHVSGLHPDDITAMATDRLHTYTASNKCIYAWRAGKHIRHVYRGHEHDVHLLLPFGGNLIAVDRGNVLKVWNIRTDDVYLDVPFNREEFNITAMAHPPTYINKIVLGSQQGQLKIMNIKKNTILCTIIRHNSRITCIEPGPALDVVAVGHGDGSIVVLNLKYDTVIVAFKMEWGMVTGLAFRTDGPPILVSSCITGYMAFWDLEQRKLAGQLQAHEQEITTTICLPSEPVVFTTSPDNSMKLFVFDMPDGGARQLRIREGHTKPPLCIRYHGGSGVSILSSGEDSTMRVFSTISESLSKSMGRATYNSKATKKKNRFKYDKFSMPPILEFTSDTAREREWDNIAAIHAGIIQTTTWTFNKNRMGDHRLVPLQFQSNHRSNFQAETTSIILTHCGNFVIIGYSTGDVERFNIQSGLHRSSYGAPAKAHDVAVRGLASDNLNQYVVSGCTEGLVKFWLFKGTSTKPLAILRLADGVALMRQHRESSMLAIALDTFKIYVVDMNTRVIVRKFIGHTAKLNDMTFSPDSRWLISAAMDSTIKVWDIPSSYMIDHFRVERPCISLSMSPSGDFLATAHVNLLGIYLWANKTLFNQISLRSIDPNEAAPYVGLPSNMCDAMELENVMEELEIDDEAELGEEIDAKYETPKQLDTELITMSGLAASRWQNLLDLELIKRRNKPKAPPKAPKQAPFFLPTVSGLEMRFDVTNAPANEDGSKLLQATTLNNLTAFGKLLEATAANGNYEPAVKHITQLGPSMVDFEIKSLHPDAGGTMLAMQQFLKLIEYMLSTNMDFELAQSYLSVYLRSHGLSLSESPLLVQSLRSVSKAQEEAWQRVESKLIYGTGVVAALRNFAR